MILGQEDIRVELVGGESDWADPSLWLPAAVALLVVIVGGVIQWKLQARSFVKAREQFEAQVAAEEERWTRQQEEEERRWTRQQDGEERRWKRQISVERERWQDQQGFEREKFMLQERRTLYARTVAEMQSVGPLITDLAQLLIEGLPVSDLQRTLQESFATITTLTNEVMLIASADFREESTKLMQSLFVTCSELVESDDDRRRELVGPDWFEQFSDRLGDLAAIGRDELLRDTIGS